MTKANTKPGKPAAAPEAEPYHLAPEEQLRIRVKTADGREVVHVVHAEPDGSLRIVPPEPEPAPVQTPNPISGT